MYTLQVTAKFKRDSKRCRMQGKDLRELGEAMRLLQEYGKLPESYRPHLLREEYEGYWECHIEDDWLMVWKQNDKLLTLLMTDTGTHEELFKKKSSIRIY